MGAVNPDRIAPPPSPLQAVTLGEMQAARWLIIADCQTCRARTHVDLSGQRRLLGDDYVLWGRTSRCKTWVRWEIDRRCPGRVTFYAQASVTGSAVPLRMTDEVRDAIDLRSQAAQRHG